MIRVSILAAACAVLAACATPGAATGPERAPGAVVAPLPPAPQIETLLRQAGQPNAPTLAVVQRTLGAPDVLRQEAAGAIASYRLETCALVLGFSADRANEMRLSLVEPGPRRAGEAQPTLAACSAELEARRDRVPVG